MSLLDDVSIVVTPNGYKAGELYAVVPVPTEGAEEVPSIIGILNAGGGTITQISGNSYSSTSDGTSGSGIRPKFDFNTTAGKRYKLTITPTGTISGTINFDFYDGSSYLFQNYDFTTTKEIYFIDNGSVFGAFDGAKTYNISSFTVSVKEYTSADMDVTRATAATRVDEDGLVNYAEIIGDEEITNGDFATDTDWTLGANTTISSGTLNFSSASSNTDQSLTTTNSKIYKVIFSISNYVSGSVRFRFTGAANVNGTSRSTNGTFTQYITATANNSIFRFATSSFSGSIDNVSVKEATIDNLPRVDYTDGTSSLLVEPQRTNVSTYSEDFSQSFYIKDSSVSVGTTNNISPSGDANATKIDVTDNGRIYANVASDTYSSSVFIKAGTFAYFKFGGSSVDLEAGTYSGGTIESFGNGWFRITTAYTGNRPFQIQAYPDGTYSSHTTNGNYYIWGAQAEAGSYATSYIPTSGSTVTRNQETYEKTGISDKINSTEGVLFLEMAALQTANTNSEYLVISDGTYNANSIMVQLRNGANQLAVWGYSGSVNQLAEIITLTDITDFNKIAIKWKVNDFEVFVNGSSVYSLGTYTAPTGLDRIEFSRNGSAYFLGKVKQLQVFKTALSDSELATLTT